MELIQVPLTSNVQGRKGDWSTQIDSANRHRQSKLAYCPCYTNDSSGVYSNTHFTLNLVKLYFSFQSFFGGYNLSHITSFDRSVKETHEIASGVPMADLTTNRPCQTSHNRYLYWANSATERWKFSLSYFKWENAVTGLSCPRLKRFVSSSAVIAVKNCFDDDVTTS